MNGTPRLRSAFPQTPKADPSASNASKNQSAPRSRSRPSVIRPASTFDASPQPGRPSSNGPLVPLDVVDGPTQRLYVASFYVALLAWRIYNAYNITDDLDAGWYFLKWVGIDAALFVALPAFRIPWMEWSFTTTFSIWLLHLIVNAFLMFKIPIPIFGWLGALVRVAYDRELSISEHRVNPADIIRNSSIILGKQIINLLPEGSAVLNPDRKAYCIDASRPTIELPIRINQTTPESIEFLRYDLDTDDAETIVIGSRQAKRMKAEADKPHDKSDKSTPRTLHYSVSKTGVYRLQRVVDKSKLDVRRRSFDVAVVSCPQASVSISEPDKCTGDLSGIVLNVVGVPPFNVKYSKRINQQQFSSITQSIQPPEQDQSSLVHNPSGSSAGTQDPRSGLTKSIAMSVDINESLHQNGTWAYVLEEVEDGLANKVIFNPEKTKKRGAVSKSLTVHKRPQINLVGCDAEKYLRVAKEDSVNMPVQLKPRGQLPASDWPLRLKYTFTADTDASLPAVEEFEHDMVDDRSLPRISKAGRYDIVSIESRFCQGEVTEPSSCLLYNPPSPSLGLTYEEIYDRCAGRPIGLNLNLDFTGTPPFRIRYEVSKAGAGSYPRVQEFNSLRGQLEFREQSSGAYTYEIVELSDEVYGPISLRGQGYKLEQNIRPPAQAFFEESSSAKACLNDSPHVSVRLLGEGPWSLDYELIHGGKRRKHSMRSESDTCVIDIPPLSDGGKYTVVLTGVEDASKCRTVLKEERVIEVRPEQPRAAFGDIEGRRMVEALEDKAVKLPLRLKGIAPWVVQIQRPEESAPAHYTLRDANAAVDATKAGTYEIVGVRDSCPGLVDSKADKFHVAWIERPSLRIQDNSIESESKNTFYKRPVCQGDDDVLGLSLTGHPPYYLKYQIKAEPSKGQSMVSNKPLSVASGSAAVNMDTSRSGHYTYSFNELSDDRYGFDKKHFHPLVVKQEVFAPPTAKFTSPGKTYGYCWDEVVPPDDSENENIAISLSGVPPFALDIAITHHGVSTKPETIRVKDILSTSYSWSLSRSSLGRGTHSVQIRSVKDSRGCETHVDSNPSTVKIQVSSPPTIVPLESNTDYCVGDRVSFSLSGQAPFDVFYTFQSRERKAHVTSHEFKRIAESSGNFIITGVADAAMGGGGKCKAKKDIVKSIHPYPTVRISHGQTRTSDIHEGGEVDIMFEFTGTPPFDFTYTRSENAKRGKKGRVLETKHDTSDGFSKTVQASDEGTYEVVAIRDRYCSYAAPGLAKAGSGTTQKLLTN